MTVISPRLNQDFPHIVHEYAGARSTGKRNARDLGHVEFTNRGNRVPPPVIRTLPCRPGDMPGRNLPQQGTVLRECSHLEPRGAQIDAKQRTRHDRGLLR